MAEPDFSMPVAPAVSPRKPKSSAYTMLLVIALMALLIGCLFLFLEIKRYGGFGVVRGRVAAISANGHTPARFATLGGDAPATWSRHATVAI